jgi:hypothetical protein
MSLPFSGIVPSNELGVEERRAMRENALHALNDRAINVKRIGGNQNEIAIRDIIPDTDFALANRWWITGAIVAGAVTTYINAAIAAMRMVVFYGVSVESAAPACSMIYFRSGPAGATTRAIGNLEVLYSKLETDGYLSRAVIYDPQETAFVQVWGRVASAGERIILRGAIAEPVGESISGPIV